MWGSLIPFVLRLAYALPAVQNGTVTCPYDALYTSLADYGGDFCSRVLEAGHCGGEYSTPSQFITVNQTRIALYCGCILTNSNVTVTPTGSENWTMGDPTATSRDDMSETSGPPAGRPGPGPPSGPSSGSSMPASTASVSVTGDDATGTRPGINSSSPRTGTEATSSAESITSSSSFNASATRAASNSSRRGSHLTSGTVFNVSATGPFMNASDTGASQTSAGSLNVTASATGSDTLGGEASRSSGVSSLRNSTKSQDPGSEPSGFPNATSSSIPQNFTSASSNGTLSSSITASGTDQPRPGGNTTLELPRNGTATLSSTSGLSSSTFSGWNTSMTASGASGSPTGSIMGSGILGTGISGTATSLPRAGGNNPSQALNSTISRSGSQTSSGIITGETGAGTPIIGGNNTSLISGNSTSRTGSTPGMETGTVAPGANNTSAISGSPISGNFSITPTPTFITPTPFPNTNKTSPSASEFPAANFTRVTRTAAVSQETCYTLAQDPEGDSTRRALLHNSKLREENASIPLPYIESVDFESGGIDPLYITVRDIDQGSHSIDISNTSRIAIVDSFGNSMLLDAHGIHFSTNSCTYSVSITIKDMYQQLADLAGVQCSTSGPEKRMEDMDFTQILNLHDQCGDPVDKSLRPYPQLQVADTFCVDIDVDESIGQWEFDCTFPGSQSGSMKCEMAIKNDVVDFLLTDPFGGACPDLSTVITTLEASAQDFINTESLRTELYNQGLNSIERADADTVITQYSQLWEVLQQAFSKSRTQPPGNFSALEEYIDLYNTYRTFEDDICEDLHAGEIPLKLRLRAGATYVDTITTLNWAPESPRPYNITIQDSSKIACCSNGTVADGDGETCAYPDDAIIGGTGCVCGRTVDGLSLAFEETECDNYVSNCASDDDCSDYQGFVCLTGSCCVGGVCVDPYACSQDGTVLVKF
ncbi:Fc.00g026990.m01.CDS01 [Cosmosporella sp. VM-42]